MNKRNAQIGINICFRAIYIILLKYALIIFHVGMFMRSTVKVKVSIISLYFRNTVPWIFHWVFSEFIWFIPLQVIYLQTHFLVNTWLVSEISLGVLQFTFNWLLIQISKTGLYYSHAQNIKLISDSIIRSQNIFFYCSMTI